MNRNFVRSLLYTPGDHPEMMRKAVDSEADACIFDLEDAIPKSRQNEARQNIREIASEVDFGSTQLYVRIEKPDTEYWLEDLETAITAGADAVSVPKVESTYDVHSVTEFAKQKTADPPNFRISLETPEGVYSGAEISRFCKDIPSVTGIGFGSADYCRAIGTPEINDDVKEFMAHVFIGYAALGDMDAYASGTFEVDNLDRLRALLEQQRELGYVGATCIHPKQVPVINDVFTPDEDEYRQAKKLVEAYEDAPENSLMVDDVFLDEATAKRYKGLVERYERAVE